MGRWVACLCGLCVCGLWLVVGVWVERWWIGLVGGGWVVCVWVCCVCGDFKLCLWLFVLCGKHSQVESEAGPAHLPNDFAGVLR